MLGNAQNGVLFLKIAPNFTFLYRRPRLGFTFGSGRRILPATEGQRAGQWLVRGWFVGWFRRQTLP